MLKERGSDALSFRFAGIGVQNTACARRRRTRKFIMNVRME